MQICFPGWGTKILHARGQQSPYAAMKTQHSQKGKKGRRFLGFLVAQLVKNLQCRKPRFDSWVRKICWRRDRLSTPLFLGFSCGSAGKESACNAGDLGLIPGLGRFPGEGKGYPLQYSGLQNSMNYTGTCSHEIKRFLLLGRKAMTNLDSI